MKTETNWEHRYKAGDTGWDMGKVSPPLKAYIDQLDDKSIDILIPGAGNAYEAEYLYQNGFKNVYVADVAETPLNNLKTRVKNFPSNQLWHKDFFEIEKKFDLIIEQTFFCALPPSLRMAYAKKLKSLLKPQSKAIGLLFDFPLTDQGPPYGGSKEEYMNYFQNKFEIIKLERCYNSHPKRSGKELFFIFKT